MLGWYLRNALQEYHFKIMLSTKTCLPTSYVSYSGSAKDSDQLT